MYVYNVIFRTTSFSSSSEILMIIKDQGHSNIVCIEGLGTVKIVNYAEVIDARKTVRTAKRYTIIFV